MVTRDFNNDGFADLAVANLGSNNITILMGNGSGLFGPANGSPVAVGTRPGSLVTGDFNGDGIPDLAAGEPNGNSITVLLGNGTGGFTPSLSSPTAVGLTPVAIATGDFNRDGKTDLAVVNQGGGNVSVLLGSASTTTTLTTTVNPASYGQNVTFTATVSPLPATTTGTITFKNGSTVLGTSTLVGNATNATGSYSESTLPDRLLFHNSGLQR